MTSQLRCPACDSMRVSGTQVRFKCKACGFIHDSRIKIVFKSSRKIAKDGMIFRENLEALVLEKPKYRSVIYK